jgi:protein-disulfide isomerase
MSDEKKIPNEIHEEKPMENINDEKKITIKKSTYNNMLKGIVAAIAIATFLGGYAIGNFDNDSDSISADEIKEMISEIEVKAPTPQPAQAPIQPSAPTLIQVSLDDDPVKGDSNAPVTVVEFSDFQCPFCSRFAEQTLPALQENYIDTGKIKFVYRDMPLANLHPNAKTAHIAAECADEQGKFWEYHDVLFEKQNQWNRISLDAASENFKGYAAELGLNSASFDTCLSSKSIADEVNADLVEAGQYGATGTPTFFIGNEKDGFIKLVGAQPFSAFQVIIDKQLG